MTLLRGGSFLVRHYERERERGREGENPDDARLETDGSTDSHPLT